MPNQPDPEMRFSSITSWVERLSEEGTVFRSALEEALVGMCEEQQADLLRVLNGQRPIGPGGVDA